MVAGCGSVEVLRALRRDLKETSFRKSLAGVRTDGRETGGGRTVRRDGE